MAKLRFPHDFIVLREEVKMGSLRALEVELKTKLSR